jgi:hypothetical protein
MKLVTDIIQERRGEASGGNHWPTGLPGWNIRRAVYGHDGSGNRVASPVDLRLFSGAKRIRITH